MLSELKSRGWSTVLNGYDRRGAKGFGFFHISVDLTEEGIEHIEDIITLVFQYINLLKVIISLIIIQSYLNPYELFVN